MGPIIIIDLRPGDIFYCHFIVIAAVMYKEILYLTILAWLINSEYAWKEKCMQSFNVSKIVQKTQLEL